MERSFRIGYASDEFLGLCLTAADVCRRAGRSADHIEETAELYGISRAHLMKVANQLTRSGFLKPVRGRSGGLTLGKPPQKIGLSDVLRATEPDFALVECFGADDSQCLITPRCCSRARCLPFMRELDEAEGFPDQAGRAWSAGGARRAVG